MLQTDRSFAGTLDCDADSAAIVIAAIALARSLGLRVAAEGVETERELDWLRAHGCDMVQGYLFSKPLPSEEFAELLREGRSLPASVPARDV